MHLKLIPVKTNIAFIELRFVASMFSVALIVGSIAALFTIGLKFGVDFRGGVTVEVADEEPINISAVRSAVSGLGLGDVKVQSIRDFAGADEAVVIFIEQQEVEQTDSDDEDANELAQQEAAVAVQEALKTLLGEDLEFRKIEVVGPTVSGELIQKGAIAVALAIGMMLIYIWFRFEWEFSLGALASLGGEVLRGFTLAMIWGIVIGTYSSIFVASPFLLATGVKRDWSKQPAAVGA